MTSHETVLNRVLLIEDSAEFRELLALHLKNAHPDIHVEHYDPPSQGRPGSDFPWSSFDLLILDYMLGDGENGLDWLRAYRSAIDFPPVIVMTAHGDEELAVKAIKYGAQYYLNKRKLDKNRLHAVIAEVMEEHHEQQANASLLVRRHATFDKAAFFRQLDEVARGIVDASEATLALVNISGLDQLQQTLSFVEFDQLIIRYCRSTAVALEESGFTANVTRVGDGRIAAIAYGTRERETALGTCLCAVFNRGARHADGSQLKLDFNLGLLPFSNVSGVRSASSLLAEADLAVRSAREVGPGRFHVQVQQQHISVPRDEEKPDLTRIIKEDRLQPRFQRLVTLSERAEARSSTTYESRIRIVAEDGSEIRTIGDLLTTPMHKRMLDRWVVRNSFQHVMSADQARWQQNMRKGSTQPRIDLMMRLGQDSLIDPDFEPWLASLIAHVDRQQIPEAIVFSIRAEELLGLGPRAKTVMGILRSKHGAKFAVEGITSASVLKTCANLAPLEFTTFSVPKDNSTPASQQVWSDLRSVAEIARNEGILLVAQRVERAEQMTLAIQLGVDLAQGYFISEPTDTMVSTDIIETMELH